MVNNLMFSFLISVLCLNIPVKAQLDATLTAYYQNIQLAQESIVKDSFYTAIHHLQKANESHSLFLRHAEIGLDIAAIVKEKDAALYFSKILKEMGIPRSYFTEKKNLTYLENDLSWQTFLREDFVEKYVELRTQFDSLKVLDQKYRKDDELFRDSLMKEDLEIKRQLIAIIDKYGFPTEEMRGFSIYRDTFISQWSSPFNILWIHFTKNWPMESERILRDAMNRGIISNSYYIGHSMNFVNSSDFEFNCFKTVGMTYIELKEQLITCCCEKQRLLDENRRRIAFIPIELEKKLIDFENTRQYGLFSLKRGRLYPTDEKYYGKILADYLAQDYVVVNKLGE